MKKIKQNTVKINNNELQKCKLGQEFKVDVITHVKSKPKPPVIITDVEHGGGNGPREPKAPAWFSSFETRNNSRLDRIESRLDGIDARLIRVENILERNNLK